MGQTLSSSDEYFQVSGDEQEFSVNHNMDPLKRKSTTHERVSGGATRLCIPRFSCDCSAIYLELNIPFLAISGKLMEQLIVWKLSVVRIRHSGILT